MASTSTKAILSFVKILVALVAGYGLAYFWMSAREGLDEWFVPYGAGLIVAVMVFVLLNKLNKGSGD
jgi:uncharacterized membrane protein YedE/YeeE